MSRILNFFKSCLPLFFFGLILAAVLFPYYRGGRIISGGEGSYFLDFPALWHNYGMAWFNAGAGMFATSLNFAFLPHLIVLQKIVLDERIINFVMIFLIYFLPFLAVYLLCLELKLKPLLSLLTALFYLGNPFMMNFLKSINQWNMLAAYIIPSFFLIILKFYRRNLALFFFFGLHSLFFAFANANPPTMALYQVAIPFFILLISVYKEGKLNLPQILKSYLIVVSSFILFNLWWIAHWFYIFMDASSGYTKQFAISWLRGSGQFIPEWWKVINLASLSPYPADPEYDFLAWHFSRPIVIIIFFIPVLLFLYFLFQNRLNKKHQYLAALILVTFSFFAKGVKGLFGGIYEFMVMKAPLFSIFKSAGEKWGILVVFFLTLCLVFGLRGLRKMKYSKIALTLLIIYVSYSIFAFTGDFIPDYRTINLMTGSRRFLDKPEYKNLRKMLNNDPENYRVLSLPGSWNYQVELQIEAKKFYTGNDPILNNTNKPFLSPYIGTFDQRFGVLYDKISHPDYLKLLGLYNLKKIVVNKDMYPWFGFREKESVAELEEIFDQKLVGEKNEVIDLYDVGDNFLPRFYVPTQVIYSPQSTQYELPELVSFNNISQRTGFFISPYEKIKEEDEFESDLVKEKSSQIIIVGELQSAIDEGKLRAGIRGMNPGGVLFPYARWRPGGLIYPYILKKEEKTKNQFLNQPEKLLRQHLFFAGKRIFEIQRWDRELGDKEFLDVLKRYEQEMNETIENLEKIRKIGKDTFWLLAEIEVSFEAFKERLLDVIRGDYGKKSQRLKLAEETTERIDKRLKAVLKHYSQARYYFEVSERGEYEALLEKKARVLDWKIENVTPEEEEKFTLGITGEQKEKTWLSFGKQELNVGEYILILNQTPADNLLSDSWNSLESVVETRVTRLFSEKSAPTVWQEIKNWEPETAYRLSFKYKSPVGRLKLSLIEEKEVIDTTWFDKGVIDELPDKNNVLLEEELVSENPSEWEEYGIVVYSGSNAKTAKLFISSESEKEKLFEVEFREATLTKIIEPKMVLRKNRSENYFSVPQITFQKVNPTKYVLEVEKATQPYFLVFSESFHRGWKAYINKTQNHNGEIVASYFEGEIKETKQENSWFDKRFYETWREESLSDDRHLLMNGYANSWYITPEDAENQGNYQIIIEYWPQRLFYWGAFVTLATIVSSLIFWLVKNVKKT